MEILNVENLIFKYPKCNDPVIRNVSFSVNEGEFIVLCGATGSGKSTLLKMLKPEIVPLGERKGIVRLFGEEIEYDIDKKINRTINIGYVGQNPKHQAVTDKVWHELAFGLENLNLPMDEMAARVAEMASYFGIEDWYEKQVNELSGGQLQLLNLASVMVMNPKILILDEPSAQLDPISASEFFTTLKKLNSDFSLTIIIAEHRLEELIPECDRLMVLKNGELSLDGSPKEVLKSISEDDEIFEALPAAYRVFNGLNDKLDLAENDLSVPLSIRDGRNLLFKTINNQYSQVKENRKNKDNQDKKVNLDKENSDKLPALEFKDVSLRYSKDDNDALRDLSFIVNTGEIYCMLGGNGSGKTTALNAAAGLLKPYEGTIKVFGKKLKEYKNQSLYNKCLSMLPQDVQTLFLHNTVREELEKRKAIDKLQDFPFDLSALMDKHPYDLSGGEQQLLALAIVLATEPKIMLLDEPTKGLDAFRKKNLIKILKHLKSLGITIVIVTHDVEFAAECADRCAMLFRGNLTAKGDTVEFLSKNNFYTTAVSRMSKGIIDCVVTVGEIKQYLNNNSNK